MKSTEYEESVVTDLPRARADECLSADSLRHDSADEASIQPVGGTLVADRLVVVDASEKTPVDLLAVGRSLLRFDLGVEDESALEGVSTWDDLFFLLSKFDSIDCLVLVVESDDAATKLKLGGELLLLSEFGERLSGRGMPKIGSLAIEGCRVGAKINWMLELATDLELAFLTAWPFFVGFAPVSSATIRAWSDDELIDFLDDNRGYVLGSPSPEGVRQLESACLTWVQTSAVTADGIPMSRPDDFNGYLADYRAAMGYWQRWTPAPLLVPRSMPRHSDETIATERFIENLYVILKAWDPEGGKNPYDYIVITHVF